jgi:hypothetical protein
MPTDKHVLELLRARVCENANGTCEFPSCTMTVADPHHIFTRKNKSTRYDPNNCVWLCNCCHRYAEQHPEDFQVMMINLRGIAWFTDLVVRKNQVVKFNDSYRAEWKQRLMGE